MKEISPAHRGIPCEFWYLLLASILLAFSAPATAGAGQLVVNPASISFGNVASGASVSQTITLTNSGGWKITVSQASVSGTGYSLSGLNLPVTLAGGQSVTCILTFTSPAAGTDTGSVSIAFTSQNNGKTRYSSTLVSVPVSGTGVSSG